MTTSPNIFNLKNKKYIVSSGHKVQPKFQTIIQWPPYVTFWGPNKQLPYIAYSFARS
jgi:hypothetical protein